MPSPLSEVDADTLVNTVDTPDLAQGGSAVVYWDSRVILIYHGFPIAGDTTYPDGIYYYTDISDLPPATIAQLTKTSPQSSPNMLLSLPSSVTSYIQETVQPMIAAAGAEAAQIAAQVSAAIGGALGNLTGPVVGNFTPILIGIGVILALMYLPKKAG